MHPAFRSRRTRRTFLAVGMATMVALVVAAGLLTTTGQGAAPDSGPAKPSAAEEAPTAVPERFYAQRLSWTGCADFATTAEERATFGDPRFDCAYLQVPLDYSQPDGPVAQLAVLRQKAGQLTGKIGSLVLNPGGPGASGIEAAVAVGPRVADGPLGRRFDVVGFDPRGVGVSKPTIQCLTGPERDAERLDLDVDNSPAGVARTEQEAKDLAALCEQRSGGRQVLANVGTRDVVRDLDILRAVLGDEKLTYLGYSYGTRIGYSYAEAFPGHVRALVLDGALDPDQGFIERVVAQNAGFQRAFDAFARSCASQPRCPLGADPTQATERFRQLVLPLIEQPVRLADGRELSYPDALTGVTQALYSDQLWSALQRGLAELAQGQGRVLKLLADVYFGRQADGGYEGVIDAFQVIGCVDDVPVTDRQVVREATRRIAEVAPFRDDGRGPNPALDACAFWPVPYTSEPHVPRVPAGLPTVLVVSVTGDPATPYQAGVDLAAALQARLLTVDGNQHTVALQGVSCVDDRVTTYLVDPATLPPEGARCTVPS